jgi:hypothetical protein
MNFGMRYRSMASCSAPRQSRSDMMPRMRELQLNEQLSDADMASWIKLRLKAGRLVVILSLEPDGSDATLHMLCDPPMKPVVPDALAVVADVIEAARRQFQ